jgi:DNA-binding transcriptional ArsR family regulator
VAKTKTRPEEAVDRDLIRALGHPLRARCLAVLNERVASPNELAQQLGTGVSNVSYHVKVLLENNCIELVKTKQRRGAIEHFYRGTRRARLSDAAWAKLSPDVRGGVSAEVVKMIFEATKKAVKAGTLDSRVDRHLSCTPVVLDDRGWADIAALLDGTIDQVLEIQAASVARLSESHGESISATISLLGFESGSVG